MKKIKIKDLTPELSRKVQEHAFELGYKWRFRASISYLDTPYLFFSKHGIITRSYDAECFDGGVQTELTPEQFLKLTKEDVQDKFELSEGWGIPGCKELRRYLENDPRNKNKVDGSAKHIGYYIGEDNIWHMSVRNNESISLSDFMRSDLAKYPEESCPTISEKLIEQIDSRKLMEVIPDGKDKITVVFEPENCPEVKYILRNTRFEENTDCFNFDGTLTYRGEFTLDNIVYDLFTETTRSDFFVYLGHWNNYKPE